MLLLDMTQYKVVKGKRLGSVLVKQFSRAQPGRGNYRRLPKDAEGYRKLPKATENWPENLI